MLSGLFVGGILLFQGTGFITGEARAADPVARNRDVTSFIGTNNLSDANYNYGLYGSPLSQTVNISNGVDAVIGKLTADSTSLNPARAVTMQINSGATLRVGRNEAGPSGIGSLYVMGPWGAENVSKLTALSGAWSKSVPAVRWPSGMSIRGKRGSVPDNRSRRPTGQ